MWLQNLYFRLGYRLRGRKMPWDVGVPQPALVAAQERGLVAGPVLDIGCGTGEMTLFLAAVGHDVTGIDLAPAAVRIAQRRAAASGSRARFQSGDVFTHVAPAGGYPTVLDFGVLHQFSPDQLPRYVDHLARLVAPGGSLLLQCFSDAARTRAPGPRPIERAELERTFTGRWRLAALERCEYLTRERPYPAWFAWVRLDPCAAPVASPA